MRVLTSLICLIAFAVLCGEARVERQTAVLPITDAPWSVVIERNSVQMTLGAIVGPNVVLSSTRSIEDLDPKSIFVRAGTNRTGRYGTEHDIVKILTHPRASRQSSDVGLIIVDPPFQLDETRQIIKLNKNIGDVGVVQVSSYDDQGLIIFNETLITYAYCNSWYGIIGGLAPSIGCMVTDPGLGPCGNDIGSPVVLNGSLIGVLGEFPICYESEWPATFTNFSDPGISMWLQANLPEN